MNNKLSPFDQVDNLMQNALEKDDISIVLAEMDKMGKARDLVGKVLARTIYLFHQSWYLFSASSSDDFNDVLNSIGLDRGHVQRYLKAGQYYNSLPESIQNKPIREIIPITNALSQGYEISEENWEKLERASNASEIQMVVTKDIKNKEPRKSSLQNYVDSKGSVYCWYNQERFSVGFLDIQSTELAVQKSVDRIIASAGIIRK